jgi:hypothetical protein
MISSRRESVLPSDRVHKAYAVVENYTPAEHAGTYFRGLGGGGEGAIVPPESVFKESISCGIHISNFFDVNIL